MSVWNEHDVIYHYTTLSGLKGILETQTLHATNFAFLNDSKEIQQIRPRLVKTTLPVMTRLYEDAAAANKQAREGMEAQGGIASLAVHDASVVVDVLYRVTLGLDGGTKFFQPFIVSFCGHKEPYERQNGLLSQWRAYGKDSGYAFVFDTKVLADMLKDEKARCRLDTWSMGDVIYDTGEDVFKKEFKGLIDALNHDIPRLLKNEDGPYTALNNAFVSNIPRYKHRGFMEEQEVRIVVSPTHDDLFEKAKAAGEIDTKEKKEIRFRDTRTPYIVLFDKPDSKLPIKRIIVGPHADKESRSEELRSYLDSRNLQIEVSCSETPLV
ncbi:MAG: DUF2971 domain-containing protein [Tardiphaga sp.]